MRSPPSWPRSSSRRHNGWPRAGRPGGPDRTTKAVVVAPSPRKRGGRSNKRLSIEPWLDPGGPERAILDVLECHGHDVGCAVDGDMTEELHALAGRQVLP